MRTIITQSQVEAMIASHVRHLQKLSSGKKADFSNHEFQFTTIADVDLSGIDFTNSYVIELNFIDCNLKYAKFSSADLGGINFTNSDLSSADFTNSDLSGACFYNCNLSHASFAQADLSETEFYQCDLSYARLWDSRFQAPNFSHSRIQDASFPPNFKIIQIGPIGSRRDQLTAKAQGDNIIIQTGCFTGSLSNFELTVEQEHRDSPQYLNEYRFAIKFIKEYFRQEYELVKEETVQRR